MVMIMMCLQQRQVSPESRRGVVNSNPSSFGRTSSDRHLSLSERKKALIESARQRYIEKHELASSS